MTDPQDPPRLIDGEGGPERLRHLVRECRSDVATTDDVKQLESRLAPLIWAPVVPPTPTNGPGATSGAAGAASTTTATGAGIKVGAAVAIAVGMVGGGLWLSKSTAPAGGESQPSVERATKTDDSTSKNLPPATQGESAAPSDDERAAPGTPETAGRSATVERERVQAATESESDLLGRAQAVLHADPNKALGLAAEHRRKFPTGTLAQEREVLAIEALERLGRHKEAVLRANSFLRSFPGSAHRSKVNAVIGKE
jgi:hypothetical protein